MGESRQELLGWLNSLLQLNFTKVEQCGTGAAYCQIFDSIYLDIPMTKVKFNVNTEYMYIQNFKVLQNAFARHNIEKLVPVEALMKCKMQDNLEFLQWVKRYWDQFFPGGEYDAVARRKGSGAPVSTGGGAMRVAANNSARRAAPAGGAARTRTPLGSGSAGGAASQAVIQENTMLKTTISGLERESHFYFGKLRDIELLVQQEIDNNPEIENDETHVMKQIQAILYSTEEGFEIPAEEGGEAGEIVEEETF